MLYTGFCWTFLESKNKIFKFYLSIDGIFNFNLSFGEFSFLNNTFITPEKTGQETAQLWLRI